MLTLVDVALAPEAAFEALLDEMGLALGDSGMEFDSSAARRITDQGVVVGEVREWKPGEMVSFVWHPKTWAKVDSELVISFVPHEGGTRVSVEQKGWGKVIGDEGGELLGWFTGEVVAPMLWASAPTRLGDWVTDRGARRPSGRRSRDVYRNPLYHWPNFYVILDALALRPDDHLLEVGCGGGAFLHEALKSGCRASAVDHSPDMVRLASEANEDSVSAGRLRVMLADATSIPYPSGSCTCAVMTGVIGFLPDPLRVFGEVYRVLAPGGRFVVYTGAKTLKGTPAAPEPMASRIRFYEDDELVALAQLAGFSAAKVEHPSLYEGAKRAGVPEPDLPLFKGTSGSQLLVATKSPGQ